MKKFYTFLMTLFAPLLVWAQETDEWLSLEFGLRGAIGFFGLIAFIVFLHGLITYLSRLGTERREAGIETMGKGVSILIVVVIAVGLLRWLES